MNNKEKAINKFTKEYNCSQAVFASFSDELGVDANVAARIAMPFGGGLSRTGNACGCLTGALMVLGLRYGDPTAPNGKAELYKLTGDFIREFKEKWGSLNCIDIINTDLLDPVAREKAGEAGVFDTTCKEIVQSCTDIITGLLKES